MERAWMQDTAGRTLKTAHAVLRVLRLLQAEPRGQTAGEIAEHLGRSRSTAINLLNTLCAEGFAVRDDRDATYRAVGLPEPDADTFDASALRTLYDRTHERSYLATPERSQIVVQQSEGRQGLPYVPGLAPIITDETHALAVGKAFLAHQGPEALDGYIDAHGLNAFTRNTLTDPSRLRADLDTVRVRGLAVDVEEFAEGYCCIAAPLLTDDGRLLGALALSVNVRRFHTQRRQLEQEVVAAARRSMEHVERVAPRRLTQEA